MTLQMIIGLVVIGTVVKVLSTAVNVGVKRQAAKHSNPAPIRGDHSGDRLMYDWPRWHR